MPRNIRFWRNVTLIGLAHVALITGLVRWSRETKTAPQSVVWMNGGAGEGAPSPTKPAAPPKPKKISTPAPEPKPETKGESEEDRPVLASAKSDIQLPAATPRPSPSVTPKPNPSPKVKVTPKPRPKATPTPTPKPKASPKIVLAKASPKPSPKVKPPPADKAEDEEAKAEAMKKEIAKAKAVLEKKDSNETPADATDKPVKKAIATQPGTGKGTSSGAGGHAGGAGGESQFGWYGSMLHDRFYSEWVQPTTIATTAKISALVKIRIEKDGRVSSFDIVRPSGNTTVDESVRAVAKRVTQVEALPAGLGNGEHYDVRINFELNSD